MVVGIAKARSWLKREGVKLVDQPPISLGFVLDACTRTENLIVGLNFGEIDANPDAYVSTLSGCLVLQ